MYPLPFLSWCQGVQLVQGVQLRWCQCVQLVEGVSVSKQGSNQVMSKQGVNSGGVSVSNWQSVRVSI